MSFAHDDDNKGGPEQGELFQRHLAATYPSENSQAGIALATLIKPVRLRQSNWLHVGWRLAAAINELINLGWPIVSTPVREHGRKRPVAEYSMPQWVLTALAETKDGA
jgi:hypothetical protein